MKLDTKMLRGKKNLKKLQKFQPFYSDFIRNFNEKLHPRES